MIDRVARAYPNFQVIAHDAAHRALRDRQRLGRDRLVEGHGLVSATHRERLEILDRVGGGDSFASGLAYGLLAGEDLQTAVEYGAAHGALAMTTPGDTTMVSKAEVLKLAGGGGARVDR